MSSPTELTESGQPAIVYQTTEFGPPFGPPPGWNRPGHPHYPVPEFASFGTVMGLGLLIFMLLRRKRRGI